MGTSSSQPSPKTEEWRYVREAYREGIREPAEISRRIALAITPQSRAAMAEPGPAICLDTLLMGTRHRGESSGATGSATPSLLHTVAQLRSAAERRLADHQRASRFTDIALDALGLAAARALGSDGDLTRPCATHLDVFAADGRLHELAAEFVAADIDRCFRYFVARDISEFVGSDHLPTVHQARLTAQEVAEYCRRATVGAVCADDETGLQAVVHQANEQERTDLVAQFLRQALSRSLGCIETAERRGAREAHHARSNTEASAADDDDAHTPPLRLLSDGELEPERSYLPVYSLEAAAGYFGDGEPVESIGYLPAPRGLRVREGLFVVRIRGRSMEPRIPDGSYAVFRSPLVGTRQGKIVLAQQRGFHDPETGGSYTVKRYESAKVRSGDSWHHAMIRLVPENPEFDPIEIPEDRADELAILAEFVTLLR